MEHAGCVVRQGMCSCVRRLSAVRLYEPRPAAAAAGATTPPHDRPPAYRSPAAAGSAPPLPLPALHPLHHMPFPLNNHPLTTLCPPSDCATASLCPPSLPLRRAAAEHVPDGAASQGQQPLQTWLGGPHGRGHTCAVQGPERVGVHAVGPGREGKVPAHRRVRKGRQRVMRTTVKGLGRATGVWVLDEWGTASYVVGIVALVGVRVPAPYRVLRAGCLPRALSVWGCTRGTRAAALAIVQHVAHSSSQQPLWPL